MPPEPLDYYTPPKDAAEPALVRGVRRAKRITGWITLSALVFACFSASDRNPLQWPAMFAFGACLFLYVWATLVVWAVQGCTALRARLRRRCPRGARLSPTVPRE